MGNIFRLGSSVYKRKQYLINPKFQLTFIAYTVVLCVIVLGVVFASNLIFFAKLKALGIAKGLPADHQFFHFVSSQQWVMAWIFLGVSCTLLLLLSVVGVLFSHRIAGPLYRLNMHMKSVAQGRTIEHVHFRKGDFFQELSVSYNEQLFYLTTRQPTQVKAVEAKDTKKIA